LCREAPSENVHESVAVGGTVNALPFVNFDLPSDHPISQREADIDGLGGELLSLLMDLDNRHHQRLEVGLPGCFFDALLFHRLRASMSWALRAFRVSAI
jgi:hypothetical protein